VLQIPSSPRLTTFGTSGYIAHKFPLLAHAANKLLSAHITTALAGRYWLAWDRIFPVLRNRLSIDTAQKLIYTKANMPKEWLEESCKGAKEQHSKVGTQLST